jgi:hypothetical protein
MVLFADISGITAMSQHMDPKGVKNFAAHCAWRMSVKMRDFGGTARRVLGDEVLAVFGAPVAHEGCAEQAVRAALALLDLDISGYPNQQVQVPVGLNTGEVMAGLMGPDESRDYTVMGDVVNTATRLRSAARPGTSTPVRRPTWRLGRPLPIASCRPSRPAPQLAHHSCSCRGLARGKPDLPIPSLPLHLHPKQRSIRLECDDPVTVGPQHVVVRQPRQHFLPGVAHHGLGLDRDQHHYRVHGLDPFGAIGAGDAAPLAERARLLMKAARMPDALVPT